MVVCKEYEFVHVDGSVSIEVCATQETKQVIPTEKDVDEGHGGTGSKQNNTMTVTLVPFVFSLLRSPLGT